MLLPIWPLMSGLIWIQQYNNRRVGDLMRLGKFTLLLLALLISLNACGTGQAVQPAEDSREITLKKAEDLLAQPDKVAVTSHYSAYAYASEEQFEKMADLLSDIDISAFTQITQEEERKQSYDETPNMVIDKGEKSFYSRSRSVTTAKFSSSFNVIYTIKMKRSSRKSFLVRRKKTKNLYCGDPIALFQTSGSLRMS